MIDRHPAVIVRAACVADVVAAVDFARDNGLLFSVRGGGHNVTGSAVADGGLMLDMSAMKDIVVDPDKRTATARARLPVERPRRGDAGVRARRHRRPGIGHRHRRSHAGRRGRAADALLRRHRRQPARRSTSSPPTASCCTVSADEHPDLFWAVRGGGGNFGVVTSFVYRLHPVGPIILGGILLYPASSGHRPPRLLPRLDAGRARRAERHHEPDDGATRTVRPRGIAVAAGRRCADLLRRRHRRPDEGSSHRSPTRSRRPSTWSRRCRTPCTRQLNDPGTPWGRQVFLKSANLKELSDPVIEIITRYAAEATSPMTIVPLNSWGGAISRVPDDATAFGHRDTKFTIYIFTMWDDPSDSDRHIAWSRAFHNELRPHMNGIYVNEMGPDERIHDAYSPATLARLVEVKNTYDPTNFFRMNQNIKPTRR